MTVYGIAILTCFFLSGTCALVYEVAWIRLLSLVFGSTVLALSTVLASFMGGLAIGSFLFGKYSDKYVKHRESSGLLRLYAFLEGGIGVYCLFTPLIFKGIETVYIKAYQGLSFYPFSILRFLLCMLVLLIPTTFMGATLPILSKYFIKNYHRLGKRVGDLYAINTFGAVLGVILAGYVLPTLIGIHLTIYMTAVMNMGIGLLVLLLARLSASDSRLPAPVHRIDCAPKKADVIERPLIETGRWHSVVILVAFGLAGLASMMYEVGWTRVLALVLGSSTYAFSTMLVTFLAGIALGSFLFARLWGKRSVSLTVLGIVELAIGFTALIIVPVLGELPYYFLRLYPTFGCSFGLIISLQFILCFAVMLIPTLLMGAAFPIASQLYTKSLSSLGGSIGTVYGANTVGCILGSFAAGFVLIPLLGVQATLWLAILVNTFIGITLLIADQKSAALRACYGCLVLIPLSLFFWGPHWDKRLMASGVAVYANRYDVKSKEDFGRQFLNKKVLYYKDGVNCTVSVMETLMDVKEKIPYITGSYHDSIDSHQDRTPHISLAVNGKTDASNGKGDMINQLMLGYLPILLHPDPQNAFVLGLGSGVTAGALSQYPLNQIDCVEIEPAIIDAARYFNEYNHNVLDNPKLNLITADGRNHLLATNKRYDIIVSEPSNPWISGISSLFTREHYELCKSRLNQNGIMVQWVHTYSMLPHDFKMIVNTFRSIFTHSQVWFSSKSDILLIGKNNEIKIDYRVISERLASFPEIRADFEKYSFDHPFSILGCFLLGEEDVQKFTILSELNTDDLPLLEFSAPKNLYLHTADKNFQGILRYKTSSLPPLTNVESMELQTFDFYYHTGRSYFDRGLIQEALKNFERAASIEPQDPKAHVYTGRIQLAEGSYLKALRDFNTAIGLDPKQASAYYYRGKTYYQQHLFHKALIDFEKALQISPNDHRLAAGRDRAREKHEEYSESILSGAERRERAVFHYKKGIEYSREGLVKEALKGFFLAAELDPNNPSTHMSLGKVCLSQGLYVKAVEEFDRVLELNPLKAHAYYYRGKAYYEQQLLSSAIEDFQNALAISPFDAVFKIGMASALIDMENFALAADHIQGVLRRKRLNEPLVWDNLATCYERMKLYDRAVGTLKMALKIAPESAEVRQHLADIYFEQGEYRKAIEMYRAAIEQNPDLVEAYLKLGLSYHRQGDELQARTYLHKVLQNDPYNKDALEILSGIHL
ncbi:MAG: fused MFS/spermidine synthase [Deltaproteobacteria bacterium]|nr:fused MFS/spermidine synthase [Deltaproteobacteria bacterium]